MKFWSATFLCDEKWSILLCREEWEQCLACSGIGERWDIRSSRFLSFSFSVVAYSAGVAITEYSYWLSTEHPLKHVCITYTFRVFFSDVLILFSLLKYTILMWICQAHSFTSIVSLYDTHGFFFYCCAKKIKWSSLLNKIKFYALLKF